VLVVSISAWESVIARYFKQEKFYFSIHLRNFWFFPSL
jgi:hypothetical protein